MNYRNRISYVLQGVIKVRDHKLGKRFEFVAERTLETVYESAWRIPSGYSFLNIATRRKTISAAVGADVELDDRGGVIIIRVIMKELPKEIPFNSEHLRSDRLHIGYSRSWEPIYHPLHAHLMVGGTTGAGKSDFLRYIIYQLVLQGYEIRIIDMKTFSFMPFDTVPGISVVDNLESAAEMLHKTYAELLEREQIVKRARNRKIIKSFRPIVVIVDEAAQIAPKLNNNAEARKIAKYCDEYCAKISQKGREPRVSLIYCTQRPDADVINGQVKANMEAAVCFRVKTLVNSQIILDRGGAEYIPMNRPGRCIYSGTKDIMCQVPYIGDDDAWNDFLIDVKTEVVDYGKSKGRTAGERIEIVVEGTDSDNRADRALPIPAKRITEQKSIRIMPSNGARKIFRGQENERHEESVAAISQGTQGIGSNDENYSFDIPEDEALD